MSARLLLPSVLVASLVLGACAGRTSDAGDTPSGASNTPGPSNTPGASGSSGRPPGEIDVTAPALAECNNGKHGAVLPQETTEDAEGAISRSWFTCPVADGKKRPWEGDGIELMFEGRSWFHLAIPEKGVPTRRDGAEQKGTWEIGASPDELVLRTSTGAISTYHVVVETAPLRLHVVAADGTNDEAWFVVQPPYRD